MKHYLNYDLGIKLGFGEKILVSSRRSSFEGVAWLMSDYDSLF